MKKADITKQYKDIYKVIPEKNHKKRDALIDTLADVLIMMEECKYHIEEEGCVTDMPQGSYSITRENPWSKVYDSKVKLQISILDKLDKMVPDDKTEGIRSAGENLAALVSKGKPVELR